MKKTMILILMMVSSLSFAEIVISNDTEKNCVLFRATDENRPVENNEKVLFTQEVYGMITENLEIDFENRRALLDLKASVILGFNKKVTNQRIQILESHPEFKNFINTVNRKIFQLHSVCLGKKNEVVYYTVDNVKK